MHLFRPSDVINRAFESLAGDPSDAIRRAQEFTCDGDAIEQWVGREATKAAAAATSYLIPGVHLLALPADVAFVFHTMAVCAWGVGHLMGCSVNGIPDLQIVLGLWAGAIPQDRIEARLQEAVRAGYIIFSPDGVAHAQEGAASYIVGDRSVAPTRVVSRTLRARMAKKITTKIALKLLPKVAAKGAAGFLGFLGAATIAWINRTFVIDFGASAEMYYRAKMQLKSPGW